MKRRTKKRELRILESGFAALVSRFSRLSKSAHKDVVYKYENNLEAVIFRILDIHLRLDSSWPAKERWLDSIEEVSWDREGSSLRLHGNLWYGLLKDTQQFSIPLTLNIRLSSPRMFEYVIALGGEGERHTFARRIKPPKYCARALQNTPFRAFEIVPTG
jgi:hypothetical protein